MSSHVRAGLGTSRVPHRPAGYSASYQAPHAPNESVRYGSAGHFTQHVGLYNDTRGSDDTQLLPRAVADSQLSFPRHSTKQEPAYSGWMEKHTGLSDKWERRWFVLEGGFLKYFYEKDGRGIAQQPKAVIPLSNYTAHNADDELQTRNAIVLKPTFRCDHEYRLRLESAFQKRTWLSKLSTGSHKGRVKTLVVGPYGVGKTALVAGYFSGRHDQVERAASYPSLGSHVGYIPAVEDHRKDLVLPIPGGHTVVSLECLENPGRGDWDHVRLNAYNGADVILAVFSLADEASLGALERLVQVEAKRHAPKVPIILVGTKADIRGQQGAMVVGHATEGATGHMSPKANQTEVSPVSTMAGREAALRMGALAYQELSGFDTQAREELFTTAAHHGLLRHSPGGLPARPGGPSELAGGATRRYEMHAEERCREVREYLREPHRSQDGTLAQEAGPPLATAVVGPAPPHAAGAYNPTATASAGMW